MGLLKRYLAPFLAGMVLSITIITGRYTANQRPLLFDVKDWCYFLILGLMIAVLIIVLFKVLRIMIPKLKAVIFFRSQPKFFFPIVWFLIFIAWIPCFLAEYPGILAYDATQQFIEGVVLNLYSNHQPVFHTMVFSFFCNLSYHLFGNFTTGIAMYTIAQMLLLSYAFAKLCDFLRQRNVPVMIACAVALGFAVIPANAVMAVNMTKDVPFTALFILFMLSIYRMIFATEQFFGRKSNLVQFVLIGFLMSAVRNQGIYIIFAAAPFLIIALREFRTKCILMMVTLFFIWVAYAGLFYHALGVVPSMVQEKLSVPLQGISRVMTYHEDDLNETEKAFIREYLPDWHRYTAKLSDPVKLTFNQELFYESPTDFWNLWLQLGWKYPKEYRDAFLLNTDGYWYIFYDYSIEARNEPYIAFSSSSTDIEALSRYIQLLWRDQEIDIPKMLAEAKKEKRMSLLSDTFERKTRFPQIHTLYKRFSESALYSRVPFAGLFMNPGYCFTYLVIVFTYAVYTKKYRFLYVWIPPVLLFGTLLLGPVSLMRYAYPIMCILPLSILILFDE